MRNLQQGERGPGDHIVAAGRDRPRHPEFRQHVEQLLRPGKRPDLSDATGVRLLVKLAQSVRLVRTDIAAGFADERAHEQAAAHTDAAVDTPDGERNARGLEHLLPREHVLIDAVQQRAVEVKQHSRTIGAKARSVRRHATDPSRSRLGSAT